MFFVFDLQGNLRDIAGRDIVKIQAQLDKDDWAIECDCHALYRGTLRQCQAYLHMLHGSLVKVKAATPVLPHYNAEGDVP